MIYILGAIIVIPEKEKGDGWWGKAGKGGAGESVRYRKWRRKDLPSASGQGQVKDRSRTGLDASQTFDLGN